MSRYRLILVLFLIAVALLYLWSSESDAKEVKAKMLDAVDKIDSYTFSVNMVIETKGTVDELPVVSRTIVEGNGKTDIRNQRMWMLMNINTEGINASEGSTELYLIGNVMYIGISGNWIKQNVVDGATLLNERHQIRQQADIIRPSEVRLVSDKKNYVLEIKPDKDGLVRYMTDQSVTGFGSLAEQQLKDVSSMIKDVQIFEEIDRDSYLPVKFTMNMLMESNKVKRNSSMVMYMGNYNEPVSIELPSSATG